MCALLLHAECHLLNYCATPLYGTLAPLITCSSGDPVFRTLSIITVLAIIPISAILHLGFPAILHCICYPFFSSSFLFFLWFVIFGKLILCSIYAFHLGCELWALLISWLKSFVVILRIHGILSKSKQSLSCPHSLYSMFLPSPYTCMCAHAHTSSITSSSTHATRCQLLELILLKINPEEARV